MDKVVVCSECETKNRLKRPPAGQVPACGKCGASLPWLDEVDDANFAHQLATSVPVLVDFWAPWCAPCRVVAPVLEELARERRGKLKILKLNVDENLETAGRFQVQSIPTLILFQDGEPMETIVGAVPKSALLQRLEPYLGG